MIHKFKGQSWLLTCQLPQKLTGIQADRLSEWAHTSCRVPGIFLNTEPPARKVTGPWSSLELLSCHMHVPLLDFMPFQVAVLHLKLSSCHGAQFSIPSPLCIFCLTFLQPLSQLRASEQPGTGQCYGDKPW